MALTKVTKTGNITVDGNVGISELNPSHKLHINGGSNDEARVRVTNTANGQASLDLNNSEGYFRTYTDAGEYRIYDQTDGVHRLVIDTEGRVTMPNQPSFQTSGTNYTQASGGLSTIIPSTQHHNTGGHLNLSQGKFTAPVTGRYKFSFWGLSYPHPNGLVNYIQFYKNGSAYGDNIQFGGNDDWHQPVAGSIIIELNVSDYVTHRYWSNSGGGAKGYAGQWHFGGYLIG